MPGYVYIMKKNRRDAHAKATFQYQYKIGIATNPNKRHKQVNRAVAGGVRLIAVYWFINPRKVEQKLHREFYKSRHTLRRAKKGAGKTEWFYLNPLERSFLSWRLFWLNNRILIFGLVFCYLLITSILLWK